MTFGYPSPVHWGIMYYNCLIAINLFRQVLLIGGIVTFQRHFGSSASVGFNLNGYFNNKWNLAVVPFDKTPLSLLGVKQTT